MPRDDQTFRDDEARALPDDLAVLGEELAAAAAHLANTYPAPPLPAAAFAAPVVERKQALVRYSRWRVLAVGFSGVACAAAVWLAAPYAFRARTPAPQPAGQVAVNGAAAHNGHAPSVPPFRTGVFAQPVSQPAAEAPAAEFHTLSAPELEGMLDLLEQQPAAATRLSI